MHRYLLLPLSLLPAWTAAQFPPPQEGLTEVKSQFDNGITIKYKEVGVNDPCSKYCQLNTTLARYLRDDSRREILLRVHHPASWHACRQRRIPELHHQHLLLVLRISP